MKSTIVLLAVLFVNTGLFAEEDIITPEMEKQWGLKSTTDWQKQEIGSHQFKESSKKIRIENNYVSFEVSSDLIPVGATQELSDDNIGKASNETPVFKSSSNALQLRTRNNLLVGTVGISQKAGNDTVVREWNNSKQLFEYKKKSVQDDSKVMYIDGTMRDVASLTAKERLIYKVWSAAFSCENKPTAEQIERAIEPITVGNMSGFTMENPPAGFEGCVGRVTPSLVLEDGNTIVHLTGKGSDASRELIKSIKETLKSNVPVN
jgi:hypothetical protein